MFSPSNNKGEQAILMQPMIPMEEANGLLAEADVAEQTGGFVQFTPEYTRHIVKLLTTGEQAEIKYCDVCPHAMHLHNPDGTCPCGMDCATLRAK